MIQPLAISFFVDSRSVATGDYRLTFRPLIMEKYAFSAYVFAKCVQFSRLFSLKFKLTNISFDSMFRPSLLLVFWWMFSSLPSETEGIQMRMPRQSRTVER